jgi:hypothetical protein
MVPLRSRDYWEKTTGLVVHPPLYTKVMGRPKKNRRQTPEVKEKYRVKYLNRVGLPMRFSICGKKNHNKEVHAKYIVAQNLNGGVDLDDDGEEADDPSILEV